MLFLQLDNKNKNENTMKNHVNKQIYIKFIVIAYLPIFSILILK